MATFGSDWGGCCVDCIRKDAELAKLRKERDALLLTPCGHERGMTCDVCEADWAAFHDTNAAMLKLAQAERERDGLRDVIAKARARIDEGFHTFGCGCSACDCIDELRGMLK